MALEPKKLALIRIWQILKEESDRVHPLTQEQIIKILKDKYGIEIERKAISRNLSLLKEAGIQIESKKKGCYLDDRDFEDSELHLLIDSVLGSKHIAVGYSKQLIGKICTLSNKYFRARAKYIHSVDAWGKTDNKELFYNIEVIDSAIEKKKQIHYDYNKYGIDKKLHKSSQQFVSPYAMVLHNQRYYLMAYSEYWKNMVFHRLDRITNMKIIDKKATPIRNVPGYENGINYKDLASAMPYMYTDKPEQINFTADTCIIDQIIDWFGSDVRFIKTDNDEKVNVSVKASPNAMQYWALQYINHVEITAPQSLREKIISALNVGVEKYK